MKLQFEVPENCTMPKVVITGNYFGSKTFPSLNNLLAEYGFSPQRGNSMKRKFMNICNDEIRMQLGNYKATHPIIIHYRFHEPRDGHYRDFPNIHSFFSKVFCDSLQTCGVIPNDNPRFLRNETHDFFYLPEKWGEPYIEIYIEELPDKKLITRSELSSAIDEMTLFRTAWYKTLERNRTILKLRLCEGYSFEDISKKYEISVNQVKKIVYEGVNILSQSYEVKKE